MAIKWAPHTSSRGDNFAPPLSSNAVTALLWIFPVWHQRPSICDDQTTLISPFPADAACGAADIA
jgi:hypothetical protein